MISGQALNSHSRNLYKLLYCKHNEILLSISGAGSSLEIMYARKPCIVVVNDKLMDNHQEELAKKLSELGHIKYTVPA